MIENGAEIIDGITISIIRVLSFATRSKIAWNFLNDKINRAF